MTSARGKTTWRSKAAWLSIFSAAAVSSGCATSKFLWQAARGQADLIWRAQPISKVLADPEHHRVSPEHQVLLRQVASIKAYGESQGLKATENYESFVALDRTAAVYVVSASERTSFRSKVWSFPIVGSFNYLGWYDLQDAKDLAASLDREGWDVDVRGAAAYSTLGWFKDAILSTMLGEGTEALADLAQVVLHESVHATLCVPHQSTFNESVASFLDGKLTERYLRESLRDPAVLSAWQTSRQRNRKRVERFRSAAQSLERLYGQGLPTDEVLAQKAKILKRLEGDLQAMGERRVRPLNNAVLVQFRTYETGTEDFESLWKKCGASPDRFLRTLKTLGDSDFERPQMERFDRVLARLSCG